jgi:hypothetical protein
VAAAGGLGRHLGGEGGQDASLVLGLGGQQGAVALSSSLGTEGLPICRPGASGLVMAAVTSVRVRLIVVTRLASWATWPLSSAK